VTERLSTVTPAVRSKLAQLGGRGEQWLASLPDLITELEELWSMTVVQPRVGSLRGTRARSSWTSGRPLARVSSAITARASGSSTRHCESSRSEG
jgi:hypothetical protein